MDSIPHQISEPTNTLKPIFLDYITARKKLIYEFSGSISESIRELETTLVSELNQQLRMHGYSDIITRDEWVEDYEAHHFESDED